MGPEINMLGLTVGGKSSQSFLYDFMSFCEGGGGKKKKKNVKSCDTPLSC